jgi:HPt (histidine-containing phosphotransfer) domain-containing protein
MNQKCTDLTYLKELAEGSNEFIVEMLDGFLTQTPEMLDNMAKYLHEKKWQELRGVAHKMKPTIDFVGIHSIKDTVKTVEQYAAEQIHLDLLPDLVTKVIQVCSTAITELKEEIKTFQ